MMKIDVFNHILTQKFNEQRLKLAPPELSSILAARVKNIPALWDLDTRFKIMDMFEDYVQVLTLANPPLEVLAGPEDALELARIGNDEMAELVAKYPDRFVAAVASIPMNNVDGALKEMDRAINELGLKGVQIFSPMKGVPSIILTFYRSLRKLQNTTCRFCFIRPGISTLPIILLRMSPKLRSGISLAGPTTQPQP